MKWTFSNIFRESYIIIYYIVIAAIFNIQKYRFKTIVFVVCQHS